MSIPDTRASLVFGVVAATGTDLEQFIKGFSALLEAFAYEPVQISLTQLLIEHVAESGSISWRDEGERIEKLMDAGDAFRSNLKRGDAMALLATLGIQERRRRVAGDKPLAFLIRQLKHPEEVSALRRIYGDRLFVISLYSTYAERLCSLMNIGIGKIDAERIMLRDEEDAFKPLGQRTRDTFELGDVFFRLNGIECDEALAEAERFLDLVFGKPTLSPRQHEHAMYLAYAASLRSADLSRQVGAAITNAHYDVIAVGANDVPQAFGGQYWPGKDDRRDHALGYDSNSRQKLKIARDIFEKTQRGNANDEALFRAFLSDIEGSLLFDITEYGRAVHAEMEAILSCARSGTSTRGALLFSTTFPCHNCAKHILDAGISEVQYVEAYPKSMALPLYTDQILWEEGEPLLERTGRVIFRHYVGVGARRYLDLFSLTLSSGRRVKRKDGAGIFRWDPTVAEPRVPSETASIDLEQVAISELNTAMRG